MGYSVAMLGNELEDFTSEFYTSEGSRLTHGPPKPFIAKIMAVISGLPIAGRILRSLKRVLLLITLASLLRIVPKTANQ